VDGWVVLDVERIMNELGVKNLEGKDLLIWAGRPSGQHLRYLFPWSFPWLVLVYQSLCHLFCSVIYPLYISVLYIIRYHT
jgi:hypothetical protein